MKKVLSCLLAVMIMVTSAYPAGASTDGIESSAVSENSTVSEAATPEPTAEPTVTPEPTAEPTVTPEPTAEPTVTPEPTAEPTVTPEPTAEPTITPEATVTPGPTAEPTPAPTASPTAAPKMLAATTEAFDITATTSLGDLGGELLSGSQFNYTIGYSIPPRSSGNNYNDGKIEIILPENVLPLMDELGIPEGILGDDFHAASFIAANRKLTVYLNTGLVAGHANTINIVLNTANFKMADGTEIKLDPVFTAQADGNTVEGRIKDDVKPVITVRANDGWLVTKSAGAVTTNNDNYTVDYTVAVKNAMNGKESGFNRYGRLELENYALTDTLPTGVAPGGEAIGITNVKMGDRNLSESEYEVQYSAPGKVSGIKIKTIDKAGSGYDFVGADTPANTTYTYTVTYPRAPYITPSNLPLKEYDLTNTAKIDYRLLGEGNRNDDSQATVTLGEQEKPGTSYGFTVVKKVLIDGEKYVFGGETGDVTFGLYFNKECKPEDVAKDIEGKEAVGTPAKIDKNGTVTFKNLRAGTYYLKETVSAGTGLVGVGIIPVTVGAGGVSSADETNTEKIDVNTLGVLNKTDTLGIVEFTKYGKDAAGNVAPLADCTFTLTKNGSDTYTAKSDANGVVTFMYIPAGAYTLRETEVSSDEYTVNTKTYPVTVEGNKKSTPVLETVDGVNGFFNTSPKGKFTLVKQDKDDATKLAGAEFEVYGPYESTVTKLPEGAAPVKNANMTTNSDGVATSISLTAGRYFIKEVKAPNGYTVTGDAPYVDVTANTTTALGAPILNEKKYSFTINKVGITKDNGGEYTEGLGGVTFNIYAEDQKTLIAELTTTKDPTGVAVTEEIFLDKGTYYYQETSVPEGYTKDDRLVLFTLPLTEGGDSSQLTVENHADYGRVKIIKKDALDSDVLLAGAKFGIYSDADCKTKVDEITTDSKGEATSKLLPGNTYYVKELNAPENYVLSADIIKVTVSENSVVEIERTNEPLRTIEITKTDSKNKKLLAGAEFGLYNDAEATKLISTAATNADGVAVFEGLQPNRDYYIKETKAAEGYVLSGTVQTVKTADKVAKISIKNDRLAKFMLKKTTEMDDKPVNMAEVTFNLYHFKGTEYTYTDKELAAKLTTDGNGEAFADNLVPGEYWLVETGTGAADDIYDTIKPRKITLEAGQNQGVDYKDYVEPLTDNTLNGRLAIEKVGNNDAGTNKKPLNATFEIYKDKEFKEPAQYVGETGNAVLLTDENGKAVSGWLAPGIYYLKETLVTGDYTLDPTPREVTIAAAKTNTLYTGDNPIVNMEKGKIQVAKKAAFKVTGKDDVEYDLTGAKFALYRKTGDNIAADIKNPPVDEIDMSAASEGASKFLDAGDYWLVETVFPKGYILDTDTMGSVEVDGATYSYLKKAVTVTSGVTNVKITVKNRTENGRLRIYKKAFYTDGALLDGAEFEVYMVAADGEDTVIGDETYKLKKVKVSASSDENGWILQTGTAGEGSAVTVDIAPGIYFVKETKTPGGEWYWYNEWTGPIEVKKGEEAQREIYNYKMTGEGTKTDGEKKPLDGATFGVFKTPEAAGAMADYIVDNNFSYINANENDAGGVVSDEQRAALAAYRSSLNDPAFLEANGILQTAVSKDGKFTFNGLKPGGTFYVLELLAPSGYKINGSTYTVIVNNNGDGFTEDLNIVNQKMGQLKVYKYTMIGGEEYPVKEMPFEVFIAVADENGTYVKDENKYARSEKVASGFTDGKGFYTSIFLNKGTYIVEEVDKEALLANTVPAVKLDTENPKYRIIEVDDGKTNTEYADNIKGFKNPSAVGRFLLKKEVKDPAPQKEIAVRFLLEQKIGDAYKPVASYDENGIFTVKTNYGTTEAPIYISDYLPEGDYRITEQPMAGLTVKTLPVEFKIKGGELTGSTDNSTTAVVGVSKDRPIVIQNDLQGHLTLQKQGIFGSGSSYTDESPLNGVEFKLYKSTGADNAETDCKGEAVATLTTANGGKATLNNIDAGNYWLKETSLGAENNGKYELDDTPIAVTINKGATTSLTGTDSIKNITTYGKLQIKKVDANNPDKGLDATFGIYTDAACTNAVQDIKGNEASIQTHSTDGGVGLSGLIPAGQVYLKETTPPGGYTYAEGNEKGIYGPYTVEANKITDASGEPIENRLKFSLTVNKTVKDSTVKLGGVKIALYGSEADALAGTNELAAKTTAEGVGSVTFESLTVGSDGAASFWYKETGVPAGYDLNENIYRVDLDYKTDSAAPNIVRILENDVLGRFELQKVGNWQGVSDNAPVKVVLKGAAFSVYAVSGDGVKHSEGDAPADTLTTDEYGKALSEPLEPGWYEVVETKAPDGYALMAESRWVNVQNNGTDTSLTTVPLENIPNKGRFYLLKQDGKGNNIGDAKGTEFKIEKYDGANWKPHNEGATTLVPQDGYTSGVMEPGRYRLIETVPPKHNITGGSIDFTLDETPVEFEIQAGVTTKINGDGVIRNNPKGTIELTKYGKPNAFADGKEVLAGAEFDLYTDNGGKKGTLVEDSHRISDAAGLCSWKNMDAGTYWIQEAASGAVTDAGYGILLNPVKVIVEAGKGVHEKLVYSAEMVNQANQGKLLITKKDVSTGEALNGAVFNIYAASGTGYDMSKPVDTVMVSAGRGVSKFLPAAESGTKYKVVEIQAPGGYTLDGGVEPIEKEITLYPIHSPASGANDNRNVVDFVNKKRSDINTFVSKITKAVSDSDEGPANEVNAPESLLKEEYKAQFTLSGYADGKNEVGAESFTVTDNDITLQYLEKNDYKDMEAKDYDYDITGLNILAAANKDPAQKVQANIYYQKDLAAKQKGDWLKYNASPVDVTSGAAIDLSGVPTDVAGIKVDYLNVKAGFTAGGITMDVTFNNRAAVSTELDHEVRKIVNKADLEWKDQCTDESGSATDSSQNRVKLNSNEVDILVPAYEHQLPQVSIINEVVDKKGVYYSGDTVKYQVTAKNHVVPGQDESFKNPVMSFRMPAFTTVDESKNSNGFLVYKVAADGSKTLIPASAYVTSSVVTKAPLTAKGDDQYDDSETIESTQYVFNFDDSMELAPGESIVISFQGIISYDPKASNNVSQLVLPAYLSSTALVPKSLENPLGLSFTSHENKQNKHDNDLIDGEVDETLQYLNETNTVTVSDSNSVSLVKSVGYMDESGEIVYVKPGQKVSVNSADTVYYKLTVINNSKEEISSARLVDIFPFHGDQYVLPSGSGFTSRGTTIPAGEGYEGVELLTARGASDNVTFYSTNRDWSGRTMSETADSGVLGSLYYRNNSFADTGWSLGYGSDTTALAMDVDFGSEFLQPGKTYDIYLSMRTPGFTADKIEEYKGAVLNNSAALSVLRKGVDGAVIINSDRVEPNKVTAEVKLPTGSIGDYAWYDTNNNGIQDAGEPAAEGVAVTLKKNAYRLNIDGDVQKITTVAGKAVTNQDGYYVFENLSCQYLKAGAPEDSQKPADYVGGEYYDYSVEFSVPEGYSAALKSVGSDSAADSNIDVSGNTEAVTLHVFREGNTLRGENNMTVDAGFVKPYSLGNLVWLDLNNNGLQDAGEKGVADVPVFLYRVDGPQGSVHDGNGYLARTVTDENGLYKFENLVEGYYVVEFDISNLKKPGGYSYTYDFTKTTESAYPLGVDSDARHAADAAGRIKRTDVIDLSDAALKAAGLSGDYDPRWDAGLTISSALGGFCFDDVDYNNIHTLNVPLPGTTVELYKVNNGFREEKPVASSVVGIDGKYYFDHLIFDGDTQDYQVKFLFPEGYTGVDGNIGSDNTADSDALYPADSERKEGFTEVITLRKDTVDTTWDAGARKYGSIGDYVWNDDNKNGRQDQGETPVPDMRVVLQSRQNGGEWQYLAETLTDINGLYRFESLKGGDKYDIEYRVVFVTGKDTEITSCQQPGVGEGENSDAIGTYLDGIVPGSIKGGYVTRTITLDYGQTDLTWDAGLVKKLSAVGDFVWYDTDYNGVQQEGDAGVLNVPVAIEYNPTGSLDDASAWKYVASTVTDANGKYLFEDLPAGYYRLRFQVPDGYTITKYDQTSDAEKDSDAMIRSAQRWFYTQSFYLEAGVTDLSWDAGIYKPKVREEVEYIYTNPPKNSGGGGVKTPPKKAPKAAKNKKTGDSTNSALAVFALLLSGAVFAGLKHKRKK